MSEEDGRGISVTLKSSESARYKSDNPWIVFHGTTDQVRQDIVKTFGMEETDGLSLVDVVANAQSTFTGLINTARGLGGEVISTASAGPAWEAERPAAKPAEPEKSADETAVERITKEIEAAKTVDEVREIWGRNEQRLFNENAELMAAWKARGKVLSVPATDG